MNETLTDYQAAIDWARELLKRDHFCILDTETTGLDNSDQIVQIALINSAGEPLLNSLVKPTVSISPQAAAIHGITDKFVSDAPTFEVVFMELMRAVGNRDLVIYNAEFDTRMIKQSLRAYGIQLAFATSERRGCRIFSNGGSIHCAMQWYSQWIGDWSEYHGNYKWQKLPGGDHSALGDCRATLGVIRQMAASES